MRVVVEADGGSRGNPGPAGFGAVVWDSSGRVLAERSEGLGSATNNVAEYEGLIAGLRAAVELGATEADVRLDSKLVVEQMSGRWRVKHASLQPLARRATELVGRLERVRFEWIPRARNEHADRLANEAMDEQAGLGKPREPEQPPAETAARTETTAPAASSTWTGAMGAPTRLVLVRHGQTAMSVDRRYSGRGDVELTPLGEQQAVAAAKRVAALEGVVTAEGAAPVITSPLSRAQQTARAVVEATGAELRTHEGLLETDFGAWEGLTFSEAAEQYTDLHRRWLGDPSVDPPRGESLQAVFERVASVQRELVEQYAGRTVVIVSHVTPIKAMLRLGLDVGPTLFYRLHLDLASVSLVEFYPDGNASVRLVNDTSHLG
ncbi:bifunctional RNase H/acid phosphatase [Halosaccharopolyspora lacisalsi]|nr:bifunctional RNase H/acid phosphatase [Halosaccharopolyspora lacisalsi]